VLRDDEMTGNYEEEEADVWEGEEQALTTLLRPSRVQQVRYRSFNARWTYKWRDSACVYVGYCTMIIYCIHLAK
jgi:hypothetical protein